MSMTREDYLCALAIGLVVRGAILQPCSSSLYFKFAEIIDLSAPNGHKRAWYQCKDDARTVVECLRDSDFFLTTEDQRRLASELATQIETNYSLPVLTGDQS